MPEVGSAQRLAQQFLQEKFLPSFQSPARTAILDSPASVLVFLEQL